MYGIDRQNRPVISTFADTWTVKKHSPDDFQAYCKGISSLLKGTIPNHNQVIGISINTSIGLAASEGLVTYLMLTAEVGLPDAVGRQCPGIKGIEM